MRKKLFLFSLLLMAICLSSCNDQKTWVEANGLKGNIISFTDTFWYAKEKFGEIHKEGMEYYQKVELNKDGQITTITKYDDDGDILKKSVQQWEDKHRLSSVTDYNEDGDVSIKDVYTYDGDKVISIARRNYSEDYEEQLSYEYDGNRLSKFIGQKDGKTRTTTFTYIDENDSYIEVCIDYEGKETESTIYLDSEGRIVEMLHNGDKYTYQYNKNGLNEKSIYANFVYTYAYKFDNKGNWNEMVKYSKWKDEKTEIDSYITRSIEYKK
ncbi:MAG: hypothetical protein IIV53_09405 [Bacteroidaceae bacterium]|nr:hypothetical protein [Bacteroidaceae bacterium]